MNSGRWGRTGKPGVLQSVGSQRVGHDLPTEQQWGLGYEKRWASQVALVAKNPPANAGDIRDMGLIPGSGRSPGGGHSNYFSILAWRIPRTEEPG